MQSKVYDKKNYGYQLKLLNLVFFNFLSSNLIRYRSFIYVCICVPKYAMQINDSKS